MIKMETHPDLLAIIQHSLAIKNNQMVDVSGHKKETIFQHLQDEQHEIEWDHFFWVFGFKLGERFKRNIYLTKELKEMWKSVFRRPN